MEPQSDSKFWPLAIGATLLFAAALLTAMFFAPYHGAVDSFRLEAAKLLLQFVLAGVGGTLVFAYLNQRRDAAERVAAEKMAGAKREADQRADEESKAAAGRAAAQGLAAARRAALQELIGQIGDAHRRLKVVKRQMRSAIAREEDDPHGPPGRPYRVPGASFERAMDALLSAQIASEEVRDRIEISVELLEKHEIARIRKALRYGARYFHDVYEDYEHGRVKRQGDEFVITPMCNNMHNFLFAREPPADLSPERNAELRALFDTMHEETRDLSQRYEALSKIETLRQSDCPRKRRYRSIATECYALAADELRQALWHTCSNDIEGEAAPLPEFSREPVGPTAAA